METKASNKNLSKAKSGKNDEFYTQLTDIVKEMKHYKDHFRGKVVLCNCDDPRVSNFFRYFALNFEELGLKKLITTCYKSQEHSLFSQHDSEKAIYLEYYGDKNGDKIPTPDEIGIIDFKGDGDFRNAESIELLKEADIIVTNPPFSLFREYVTQLVKHDKKFLIVGNVNAISYKECFEFIKENKMWLGYNCARHFRIPDGTLFEAARSFWYTNLDISKRHEDLILYRKYNEEDFTKYSNYDAINIDKVVDIPEDYSGFMGVPITFIDKYNPDQFEIIGIDRVLVEETTGKVSRFRINGREIYARIIIKNKKIKIV